MPHCIVEYSKDMEQLISPSSLLSSVFRGTIESELFSKNDIKVRAIAYEHFSTGELRQNFVHVTVKILSGRSLEQRSNLANLILGKLVNIKLESVSLTVEITEIEKDSYAKHVK